MKKIYNEMGQQQFYGRIRNKKIYNIWIWKYC